VDDPNMGARIWCSECGARPFPPAGTRQDFDLMKIRGQWRCSQHRDVAVEMTTHPLTKWGQFESLLDELNRFVANMDVDEDDRAEALELIDRMGVAVERLR
jgi:hypothetical protein